MIHNEIITYIKYNIYYVYAVMIHYEIIRKYY